MTGTAMLAAASVAVPALASGLLWMIPRRAIAVVSTAIAVLTSGLAAVITVAAVAGAADPHVGRWIVVDAAGGLLVAVVGAVGLVSVLVSPGYLRSAADAADTSGATDTTDTGDTGDATDATDTGDAIAADVTGRRSRRYYSVLFAFWAVLLAVPLAGNLGAAWLLIEATTAASALLVGFSGKPRALEAGWKYLVLTSLGLGVALLGIALVAAGVPGGGLGALSWRTLATYDAGSHAGMVAYLLLIAGLAAKVGWAPVHNWLPDAHSEAPAPVSAMLSAALLPAVLLVAWRCQQGMAPAVGARATQSVLIAFGLASVAVAVPFLARSLPYKRLLAYSSLEHMGIIALGVGFASPLALAGVVVHLAGHAVAKALGFTAVTPLLAYQPAAARRAVTGVGRAHPALGATIGLSLGALSGLPPSPLFVSELLIVAGGFQAGHPWAATAATALVALAFLGLLRALLETTLGEADAATGGARPPGGGRLTGLRTVGSLAVVSAVVLLTLAGTAVWLPDTGLVDALVKGIQ